MTRIAPLDAISVPRWKPHLTPISVPPDRLFLVAESGEFIVRGDSAVRVAAAIDGARDVEQIIELLRGEISEGQVRYVLAYLTRHGYLCEAFHGLRDEEAAYFVAHGASPEAASERETRAVAVRVIGAVDAAPLLRALSEAGIEQRADAALEVVWVDDYLRRELAEVNDAARRLSRPWILCRPVGLEIWVGPLFVPEVGACWECLRQRLSGNRDVEEFLRQQGGYEGFYSLKPRLPSTVHLAAAMVTTEVARCFAMGQPGEALQDKVLTLHTASFKLTEHRLVRRPQCGACGDPGMLREPRPVVLRSTPKGHTTDGGHRIISPARSLSRLAHHVSPITGIVRALERGTPADDELQHVFLTGQNMAQRHGSVAALRRNLRSSSCGKGISEDQAKMSAIGEAIERYSGVFRGDEPVRRTSLRALGGDAIDPRRCMLYSDKQYANREAINARGSNFNLVPLPFDPDQELAFSPLWSLTKRALRWLPTTYLYYSVSVPDHELTTLPDSNGCAAGNTLEEAILQGLLELIERDAVATWWYPRSRVPGVDLDAIDHPYVQKLRARHRAWGRELWVLDVTNDLGIPVFVAISGRTAGSPEDIAFAPAAHLDPEVALLRALTELNQMMPAVESGNAPGEYAYDDPECVHWWRSATRASEPYLLPAEGRATRIGALERTASGDIADDIRMIQRAMEQRGTEVLVLDQSRPDTGLAVAKVIVPGLRHFWARFAGGRLYDVPVTLGWRDRPLTEDELNPTSIFI